MDSKNQTAAMGILLTISAAHFLNDLLQSVIPASLPVLKEANALTFAEVGLITLTVQITSSLLQPFVGAVRKSRKGGRPPVRRGNMMSKPQGKSRATVLGSRAGRRLAGIIHPVLVTGCEVALRDVLDPKSPSLR